MADVWLEVNDVPLRVAGAWQVNRSLLRLLGGPALRGENTVIPGADGRDTNPVRPDETIFDLELLVRGKKDADGTPHTDEVEGKFLNLEYLRDNVATPSSWPGDTCVATLHRTTFDVDADVQVLNWHIASDDGAVATVTFDLRVPAGMFVASGS